MIVLEQTPAFSGCLIISTPAGMRHLRLMTTDVVAGAPLYIADAAKWNRAMQKYFSVTVERYAGDITVRASAVDGLTDGFLAMFDTVKLSGASVTFGDGSYTDWLMHGDGSTRSLREIAPLSVASFMKMQRAPWYVRKRVESWGVL